MWQRVRSDKRLLGILAVIVVLAAVPLTLQLSKHNEDIRQHAATQTSPQVCTTDQATDTMMIFDQSGSMSKATSDSDKTSRLKSAQNAANAFLDILTKRTQTPLHAVSLTVISSESRSVVKASLTTDLPKVRSAIAALSPYGDTCIECAIRNAMTNFDAHQRNNIKNVAVILTDGGATQSIGGKPDGTNTGKAAASKTALAAALDAHNKYDMAFYTIGFGDSINDQLLIDMANQTGGQYYFAPTASKLTEIYQQIAQDIGKGGITGTVYQDTNGNKGQDTTEPGLSGWTVTLTNTATNTVVATVTTDDSGVYNFTGLCDGAYQAKVTVKSGWSLTSAATQTGAVSKGSVVTSLNFGVQPTPPTPIPTNTPTPTPTPQPIAPACVATTIQPGTGSAPYTAFLHPGSTGGSGVTTQGYQWDFDGNGSWDTTTSPDAVNHTYTTAGTYSPKYRIVYTVNGSSTQLYVPCSYPFQVIVSQPPTPTPTATPIPNHTLLNLQVFLHGIGNSGDNANPNSFATSNKNPLHPTIRVTVEIYTANEPSTLVISKTLSATYDSSLGGFPASLDLGTDFPTGSYNLVIKSDRHLTKRYPQTISITSGTTRTLSPVHLIAGDVDGDNALTILDYDLISGCFSDIEAPVSCTTDNKIKTDLNDDGVVNQIDYNLFLRELSVQNGD
ncbi:MAG TPA: SdrD B-like domain-containing protein [Patescibacteria group bacterium]|nr:SdrD B-like domain-containing protein [Patescibacteria group bacterium]